MKIFTQFVTTLLMCIVASVVLPSIALADATVPSSTDQYATAFEKALGTDDADAVKLLLTQGMSPNQNATSGDPILYHSVFTQATKIVQLLLDKGADVNAMSPSENLTPLLSNLASPAPNKHIFDILMSAKPDLKIEDNFGDTPLDIAELENGTQLAAMMGNKPTLSADNSAIMKALHDAKRSAWRPTGNSTFD